MTILSTTTSSEIDADVLQGLSKTPYACTSIQRLSGGYVNFTYRGNIRHPLPDGATSVILKHGRTHYSGFPDNHVTTDRCRVEQYILRRINNTPLQYAIFNSSDSSSECKTKNKGNNDKGDNNNTVAVKVPRLYHFLPESNTQVMQDISSGKTLQEVLQSLSEASATSIAEALGRWAASMHAWPCQEAGSDSSFNSTSNTDPDTDTNSDEDSDANEATDSTQDTTAIVLANNTHLHHDFMGLLSMRILQACGRGDERVRRFAQKDIFHFHAEDTAELERPSIIHGDLNTRNILIQQEPSPSPATPTTTLTIIDWESSTHGSPTRDIGNLLACLYVEHHFYHLKPFDAMLRAFMRGYGPLDEKQVFRVAVYTAIYLFSWRGYTHGEGEEKMDEARVRELHCLAGRLLVIGLEGDREGLRGSFLGALF